MEVLDEVKITKEHRWYYLSVSDVILLIGNLILLLISYQYFFNYGLATAQFAQLVSLQLYVTLPFYIIYMIYQIWGQQIREYTWGAALWSVFIARFPNLLLYIFAIAVYLLLVSIVWYFLMGKVEKSIFNAYPSYIDALNLTYYTKIIALISSNICFMFFNNSQLIQKRVIEAEL